MRKFKNIVDHIGAMDPIKYFLYALMFSVFFATLAVAISKHDGLDFFDVAIANEKTKKPTKNNNKKTVKKHEKKGKKKKSAKPPKATSSKHAYLEKDISECLAPSQDLIDERDAVQQKHDEGYSKDNSYVRPYQSRRGELNEREQNAAKVAWHYFERFTQEKTGLANSVGKFPSTTLWDTASYLSALVSAYELCIIDKYEFDRRMFKLLNTLKNLDLFRGELPNKAYNTKTGEKVDYTNKPGEIGYSALDLGRFLIWMRIVKNRYAYLGNTIDAVLLEWNYGNVIDKEGNLFGAHVNKHKEVDYHQEGRLGYEEYAAKGFELWGFKPTKAISPEPYKTYSIYDVKIPVDGRDPRIFQSHNFVVTEGYVLDGIELNWDVSNDHESDDIRHSHGWRAEFADKIYLVQQRRYEREGYLTARSEHNVKGSPYFVYDAIYAAGYPWNTITPRGDYEPDFAAVSTKAAFSLWALWDTSYTDHLIEAVMELYNKDSGFYEGLYEHGNGAIGVYTANNNGILLASLLYKVQGKILTRPRSQTEVWYTAFKGRDIREKRNLPENPRAPKLSENHYQ